MDGYNKRGRNHRTGTANETAEESQLTLNLKKDELFDPYVVLPHPEVNPVVYEAVDRFVQRYGGDGMKISIMSGDDVNPSIQEVFREAYRSHYDDELQKTENYLHRRYVRVFMLVLVCIAALLTGSFLSERLTRFELIAGIVMELGVFCLWEIGYTHFDRSDASLRKKTILRARNAEIEFL